MTQPTKQKVEQIKKIYGLTNENFEDFLMASTYSIWELIGKDKRRELSDWRHIGALFATIKTGSMLEASKLINRDHATIINSFKMLMNNIDAIRDNLFVVKYQCRKRMMLPRLCNESKFEFKKVG